MHGFHPVIGVTDWVAVRGTQVLTGWKDGDKKSRSSGFEVTLLAPPYRDSPDHRPDWVRSGWFGAFVARYSGATAQDFRRTSQKTPAGT